MTALFAQGQGAAPAGPGYYQVTNMIKVAPGKSADYAKFMAETSAKMARTRADDGEIASWMLLRSVFPAGQEARCDYMISTIYNGPPPAPRTREDTAKTLAKAGVSMTADQFYTKRDSFSTLVSTEMWRPRVRVGAGLKGHYLYLNMMKVRDAAAFTDFELNVQQPMFAERVKSGEMSGWSYGTKVLPAGTDTAYTAYSADSYPTWEAAFKPSSSAQALFAKVHPGKNYQDVMGKLSMLRDHAKRELWVVVERVDAKLTTVAGGAP